MLISIPYNKILNNDNVTITIFSYNANSLYYNIAIKGQFTKSFKKRATN